MIKKAVPPTAVTDEEQGCQKHQGTNGTGLPLQKEAEQVEPHEHGVVKPQGRVQGLGYQEDWQQPLKAVHGCFF